MLIVLGAILALYLAVRIAGVVCEGAFLDYVDSFQRRLGVSNSVAGELLQAPGTSAPEIAITAYATYLVAGSDAVGVSTIIGSAAFQITLVIAIPLFVLPLGASVGRDAALRSIAVYTLAVLGLVGAAWDGFFAAWELLVLFAGYGVYAYYLLTHEDVVVTDDFQKESVPGEKHWFHAFDAPFKRVALWIDNLLPRPPFKAGFLLALGVIGGTCAVAVELATLVGSRLGVGDVFMALTVLAAGSSIPELASNAAKAREGKLGQIIGNAFGSNSFDILVSFAGVSVLAAFLRGGIRVADPSAVSGAALSLLVLLLGVTAVFAAAGWRNKKWVPYTLIGFYTAFIWFQLHPL
jgi:Ca2+/Na+ antiporter